MSLIGREFYESALRLLARTEYAPETVEGRADAVRHLAAVHGPEPDEHGELVERRFAR